MSNPHRPAAMPSPQPTFRPAASSCQALSHSNGGRNGYVYRAQEPVLGCEFCYPPKLASPVLLENNSGQVWRPPKVANTWEEGPSADGSPPHAHSWLVGMAVGLFLIPSSRTVVLSLSRWARAMEGRQPDVSLRASP